MSVSLAYKQATAYIANHMSHPSFVPFHDPKQFANPKPFNMEDTKVESFIDATRYAKVEPFSMEQSN